MSHRIPQGVVHLWLADPDALENRAHLERCRAMLTEDEWAQSRRFRVPEQRRRSLLGRALVRAALSEHCRTPAAVWRFSRSPGGRPRIESPDSGGLHFSLSSTPGLVACAVSATRELGIDVEAVERTAPLEVARHLFAPEEADDLLSRPAAEQPQRFFELWTLKEAYLKARGLGLAVPPRDLAFPVNRQEDWRFARLRPTPQHRASIAARWNQGAALHVAAHWWKP